jgi:hypothetical protein
MRSTSWPVFNRDPQFSVPALSVTEQTYRITNKHINEDKEMEK